MAYKPIWAQRKKWASMKSMESMRAMGICSTRPTSLVSPLSARWMERTHEQRDGRRHHPAQQPDRDGHPPLGIWTYQVRPTRLFLWSRGNPYDPSFGVATDSQGGPTMRRKGGQAGRGHCQVCGSKQQAEINAALVAGKPSLRKLAQVYKIGVMSLSAHRKNHLSP